MADENGPPKDLEVRLTELENAVKTLTQSLQPAAATTALSPQICSFCYYCYYCHQCVVLPTAICRECNQ